MTSAEEQTIAAEAEWLERWSTGPTESPGEPLPTNAAAPDLALLDHTGRECKLSEFWADGPALLMFWRHFGCGCGFERARRLNAELVGYRAAGLNPVIIGQGEPARAAEYQAEHQSNAPSCATRSRCLPRYGIGHWSIERVLPGRAARVLGPPAGRRDRFPVRAPPTGPTARRRPVACGRRIRHRNERSRSPRLHVPVLRGLSQPTTAGHRRADQPLTDGRHLRVGKTALSSTTRRSCPFLRLRVPPVPRPAASTPPRLRWH